MIILLENCMIYSENNLNEILSLNKYHKIILFDDYNSLIDKFIENNNCKDEKFIIFSSVKIAKKILIKDDLGLKRGLIYNKRYFQPSFYTQYIDRSKILNNNFVFLPFGQIRFSGGELFDFFNSEKLFIKSDKNDKNSNFAIITKENYLKELELYKNTYKLYDDELYFISDFKNISPIEKRYWICDGNIIAGTTYSHNNYINCKNNLNYEIDYDYILEALHDFLLIENWLVVDLCKHNEKIKIVELNAFSTSGFYENINFKEFFDYIENSLYL